MDVDAGGLREMVTVAETSGSCEAPHSAATMVSDPPTPSLLSSLADQAREDAAIWSKVWVCIGFDEDIPDVGDVLPFTVGHHGIHVERLADGALIGRFNKAQHGGCRVVPLQCRTGTRTRCSFTACGYSWDRRPIRGNDPNRAAYLDQYLGLRPERLLPVAIETWGPLLLARLDPTRETTIDWPEPISLFAPFTTSASCDTIWREVPLDWKVFAARWAAKAKSTVLFPNVVLYQSEDYIGVVVLQPVALHRTLCRIRVYARTGYVLDAERTASIANAIVTAGPGGPPTAQQDRYAPPFSMDLATALEVLRHDPATSHMYRTDERDAW